MKRLHVHVAVDDLDRSIDYYATLFGTAPTLRHDDYAKWRLEDPKVNFAISARGAAPGVDHLGIEVDNRAELDGVTDALRAADRRLVTEENARCCHARSDKTWSVDPSGLRWETFHTHEQITDYGDTVTPQAAPAPCCAKA